LGILIPNAAGEEEALPTLTDLRQYYTLLPTDATQRYRYSWDLDINYYDPDWKLMWVESNGNADFLLPGNTPLPILSGQRVRFEGEIVPAEGLSLKGARLTILPGAVKNQPWDTKGTIADYARFTNRLVSIEAIVDRQSEPDSTHLMLEASAEEHHVIIRVLIDPKVPRPQLEGAVISATGVYTGQNDFSGKLASVSLWVPGIEKLKVINWLSTDPRFSQPDIPIEEISQQPNGKVVKVVGTVHSFDNAEAFVTLRDPTGQVVVSTAQTSEIRPGAELEAIGACETAGVEWRLRNAVVRPRHQIISSKDNLPSEVRSKLRLIDQVLALKPAEANRGLPVQLFGVVTWADPAGYSLFVQDVTRGVEVLLPKKQRFAPPIPCSVRIVGHSTQGPFAPMVIASEITWNNPLGAPEPRATTLDQLMTGREHGCWVEIHGYLRNVSKEPGFVRLDLTEATGDFTAELPPEADVSDMLGAVVSLRGVCSVIPNDRRQLVAVKLLVPSLEFVRVVEAAQKDPFAAEESSIASLSEFTPSQSFLRRVRTGGTVLLHDPGRFIAIQDGKEALLVLCRDRIKLEPGDYIEAVGIPGREGAHVVLREASCRRSKAGKEPPPLIMSGPQVLSDRVDGHLVRLDGTIVGVQKQARETSFTLQAGDLLFEATLASSPEDDSRARIGSQVSLTGVYRTKFDEYRQPIDFTLLLRSERDILVVQTPPLWTAGRALTAAAIMGMLVIAGVSWVVVLRKRVKRQTELIRGQFEREAQLEAELQKAARIESVGLLAGGIAHDFNNLLTVILGNISFALTDNEVAKRVGEILHDANQGALRASDLTQKLLTFSKGGSPARAVIQLSELVRETVAFASHGSNVRCDYSIPPDLWNVDADRTQIGQVVQNLTINALQAMPAGGVMKIELANVEIDRRAPVRLDAGQYVVLSISDTGAGIEPEILPRVFDPYFTTKLEGNGLGLATAYSIVRKHLGHIEAISTLGKGTTFRVWLPATKRQPDQKSAPAPGGRHEMAVNMPSARVLVMDDEENIRLLCSKALGRLGFEVTTTADGAEAVQEFSLAWKSGRPYHLVIFDLTIPGGMGGKDAMIAVRKIDPSVRSIVSSGYSNDPVLADYGKYGFDAVGAKPYMSEEMTETVRQLLSRKKIDPGMESRS
jgi:signal transduction histidine kinase/CheY-like chemotaxis protein